MNIFFLVVVLLAMDVDACMAFRKIVQVYDDQDEKEYNSSFFKRIEKVSKVAQCTRTSLPLLPVVLHHIIESYHEKEWMAESYMTDQEHWFNFLKANYICLAYMKGEFAAGNSAGNLEIYSVDTSKLMKRIEAHDETITAITYQPDTQTLYSCGQDDFIKIWDSMYTFRVSFVPRCVCVTALLSFDKNVLISGNDSGNVTWWDVESKATKSLATCHLYGIRSLAKLNERCLISSSRLGRIDLLDMSTNQLILKIWYDGAYRNDVVVVNEHEFAAVSKTTILIYDVRNNKQHLHACDHKKEITAIAMIGKNILSGSEDGTINILDPRTAKMIGWPKGRRFCFDSAECAACDSPRCDNAPRRTKNIMALAADPDASNFVSATAEPVGTLTHWRYTHPSCGR